MQYLFSTLLFLHGVIHLLGFIKAFNLVNIQQLSAPISKGAGLIWLLVFVLFVVSGITFLTKHQWWSILAFLAIILSTFLTILAWKDAKFASIPNLIILLVAAFSLSQVVFNQKISNEISQLIGQSGGFETPKVTTEQLAGLPSPVAKWLKVSGVVGKEKIHSVWLSQKAKMKMKPGQENWNSATAEQYITVQKPAFVWKVKLNMSPFIKITGRDKFVDGKGEMQIKIFSLVNIVNEKGVKMDEGTLQRYLGEIVWFPSAALSPFITWEEIDSRWAKATMDYKGTKGSGTFHFNEKGDFIQYSTLRYKGNEPDALRCEWVIDVKEHAVINGVGIPVKMTATWKLDEGDWTWLKLQIEDIKYNLN
ncbi:hypothetical protein SAMN06265379_11530 [Saccharicrinis carchari]|uniref:Uncharacterized protein n=1 Tax=Saccharicrinis carchari TaxID=1168039 RepID=A0A521F8H2_SACCC|nr:DUF6544 family protein [Saccharicrinis carchari]SMO91901.1 hypothetical protein SAMN06265379_11530 [Saccharicrinis carchari]